MPDEYGKAIQVVKICTAATRLVDEPSQDARRWPARSVRARGLPVREGLVATAVSRWTLPAGAVISRSMRRSTRRTAPPTETLAPRPPASEGAEGASPSGMLELDLIDGLFTLPVQEIDDLLDLIAPEVARVLGLGSIEYRAIRVRSRRLARAHGGDHHDSLYEDSLRELATLLDLGGELVHAIRSIEVEAFRSLLAPRPRGFAACARALSEGRSVVVRVPPALPPELVAPLLAEQGLHDVPTRPAIGEPSPGSRVGHPPPVFDRFRATVLHARLFAPDESTHSPSTRALLGTMACLHDEREERFPPSASLFGGDAWRLGHDALGPLLLGFAKWTLETAKERGYDTLLFLARDGKVVQRACELVARVEGETTTGPYVLCSRRSAQVAAMTTPAHVPERFVTGAEDTSIGSILERRLGLDPARLDEAVFRAHGLEPTSTLGSLLERDATFASFLHAITPTVLENAAREREAYLAYLAGLGIRSLERTAVVDVGYSGTMQASLDTLFGGGTGLGGLYLLTYRSIVANVERRHMRADGYVAERIDPADTDHSFVRFAYLYETMFSGLDTSFVRFDRRPDGTLAPVYVEAHADEARRVAFVSELQRGALDFVASSTARWGRRLRVLDLDPRKTMRVATRFFERPDAEDARHFQGVPHEDAFGAHGVHGILPPDARLAIERSVWEPGRRSLLAARAARGGEDRPPLARRAPLRSGATWVLRGVAFVGGPFLSEAKREKLRRDPAAFFADASSPILRSLGRAASHPEDDD